MLCQWNVPSPGVSYDFMQPIFFLPFTKDDLNKPKKDRHVARESSWGRGGLNPFGDGFYFRCRTHPAVVAAARRLYDELRKVHGQQCAAEVQWPADYPSSLPGSDPLMNEAYARRLFFLALQYLADKGFLVVELMAEQDAGLMKPLTRAKGQEKLSTTELYDSVEIGAERIHVERRMRRGRQYCLINRVVPIAQVDIISDEVFVAFFLQPPVLMAGAHGPRR